MSELSPSTHLHALVTSPPQKNAGSGASTSSLQPSLNNSSTIQYAESHHEDNHSVSILHQNRSLYLQHQRVLHQEPHTFHHKSTPQDPQLEFQTHTSSQPQQQFYQILQVETPLPAQNELLLQENSHSVKRPRNNAETTPPQAFDAQYQAPQHQPQEHQPQQLHIPNNTNYSTYPTPNAQSTFIEYPRSNNSSINDFNVSAGTVEANNETRGQKKFKTNNDDAALDRVSLVPASPRHNPAQIDSDCDDVIAPAPVEIMPQPNIGLPWDPTPFSSFQEQQQRQQSQPQIQPHYQSFTPQQPPHHSFQPQENKSMSASSRPLAPSRPTHSVYLAQQAEISQNTANLTHLPQNVTKPPQNTNFTIDDDEEEEIESDIIPCRVHVKGLEPTTTEHDLRAYFGKFGPITNVLVGKQFDGTSKNFAFVSYQKDEDARRAIDIREHTVCGKRMWANNATRASDHPKQLKVLSLPMGVTRQHLLTFYSNFGEIHAVKMLNDPSRVDTYDSSMPTFAFVQFKRHQRVYAAMKYSSRDNPLDSPSKLTVGNLTESPVDRSCKALHEICPGMLVEVQIALIRDKLANQPTDPNKPKFNNAHQVNTTFNNNLHTHTNTNNALTTPQGYYQPQGMIPLVMQAPSMIPGAAPYFQPQYTTMTNIAGQPQPFYAPAQFATPSTTPTQFTSVVPGQNQQQFMQYAPAPQPINFYPQSTPQNTTPQNPGVTKQTGYFPQQPQPQPQQYYQPPQQQQVYTPMQQLPNSAQQYYYPQSTTSAQQFSTDTSYQYQPPYQQQYTATTQPQQQYR